MANFIGDDSIIFRDEFGTSSLYIRYEIERKDREFATMLDRSEQWREEHSIQEKFQEYFAELFEREHQGSKRYAANAFTEKIYISTVLCNVSYFKFFNIYLKKNN